MDRAGGRLPYFQRLLPGSARPVREWQVLNFAARFPIALPLGIAVRTPLVIQVLAHSSANHSLHCSAVQAAFSSTMGLALGRFRRFSTVNRGGSGIAWAVSQ